MKLFNSLLLFVFLASLPSCNDKEDGDVEGIILTVSPSSPIIVKDENDVIEFIINIVSGNNITKVQITEGAENELDESVIYNESPNTTRFSKSEKFRVKLPPSGSEYYEYTFTATDNEGLNSSVTRKIYMNETSLLTKDAVTLNSAISEDNLSGYDFINTSVVTGDTTLPTLGFYDGTDSTSNTSDTLSTKWIGVNESSFVKNNSFKYEDATYNSIQSTFEASTPTDNVSNLSDGDIILIKYKDGLTDKYALIKILVINDNAGSNEDSYIFNLKYQ